MLILPETSTKKYKLKRRLFGTVEILGHFFIGWWYLSENIIHLVMNMSLLHTSNITDNHTK